MQTPITIRALTLKGRRLLAAYGRGRFPAMCGGPHVCCPAALFFVFFAALVLEACLCPDCFRRGDGSTIGDGSEDDGGGGQDVRRLPDGGGPGMLDAGCT